MEQISQAKKQKKYSHLLRIPAAPNVLRPEFSFMEIKQKERPKHAIARNAQKVQKNQIGLKMTKGVL